MLGSKLIDHPSYASIGSGCYR